MNGGLNGTESLANSQGYNKSNTVSYVGYSNSKNRCSSSVLIMVGGSFITGTDMPPICIIFLARKSDHWPVDKTLLN